MWKFLRALLGGRGSGLKFSYWFLRCKVGAGFHSPRSGCPWRGWRGCERLPAAVQREAFDVYLLPTATVQTPGGGLAGPPSPLPGLCGGWQPRKISGNVFPFLLVFLSCSCLAQGELEKVAFSPLSASRRTFPISARSGSCHYRSHCYIFTTCFPKPLGSLDNKKPYETPM